MRHNILTMSQAFAFPLPVGFAAVSSCSSSDAAVPPIMNLGLAVASIWLAGASFLAPKFAFGYDLYSPSLKVASGLVHVATSVASLLQYYKRKKQIVEHQLIPTDSGANTNVASKLWGICSLGLLWFTICPVFAPYPLATVPTILGKRLSRPASAFTFLGAALAFCMRQLELRGTSKSKDAVSVRRGLLLGSSMHLTLIALKLIGVDGGGFLFPGNGLWEVYPAMLAVPYATTSSLLVHALVCVAATR